MSAPIRVAVIGGGPAGLSAAVHAAKHGARVTLIDENPRFGGQIWRGGTRHEVTAALEQCARLGVRTISGTTVLDVIRSSVINVQLAGHDRIASVEADRLVLASGARELFLPFDGWTVPGVFGLGGLQALVKGGFDIRGKRVSLVGSGPLMLAVASVAREAGAEIVAYVEQASAAQMLRALGILACAPSKWEQFTQYANSLSKVPVHCGYVPVKVIRGDHLSLFIANGVRQRTIDTDLVACGFGLVPNLQLARNLGLVREGRIPVDSNQRTVAEHVYAAGECVGIGGVDAAIAEGAIAGAAAAGEFGDPKIVRRRDRARTFVDALQRCFELDDKIRLMHSDDAILCRCEDVRMSALRNCASWRELKLLHRCGMGICQARVCGPAVACLTGWKVDDARPPADAVKVGDLLKSLKGDRG